MGAPGFTRSALRTRYAPTPGYEHDSDSGEDRVTKKAKRVSRTGANGFWGGRRGFLMLVPPYLTRPPGMV